MRLKRLDLLGFKTFAAHTVVEFHSGITAIVGPNGSGKSNVSDALRWVLGEQSVRQIRARRSEDVIFAGGTGRAPAGMAEVTLTVESDDAALLDSIVPLVGRSAGDVPTPHSNGDAPNGHLRTVGEIAITRRIHRSAETEYLLNGRKVRLRDIADVLARSRLGQNPYAIISQGMVDATLNLRPEERRGLLDEAADVRRHQQRIAEAQERLAATLGNLARVNDLLAELTPRLGELQQAAERAEAYFRLQRQVIAWLKHWYALQRDALRERVMTTDAALEQARAAAAAIVEQRESVAAELARLVERRRQLRSDHEAAINRRTELDNSLAEHRRELAVVDERLETARRRRSESSAEAETVQDEIVAADRAAQAARERVERLQQSIEDGDRAAADIQAAIAVLEAERKAVAARIEQREAETRRVQIAIADTQGRLAQVDHRIEELQASLAQRAQEAERAQEALAAAREALNTAQSAAEAASLAVDAKTTDRERLEQEIAELNRTISAVRAAHLEQESERRHLEKRAELLANRTDPSSGLPAGVRAVLHAARSGGSSGGQTAGLRGIRGIVGELIRVPKEYETAIEVALGGRLHDIVVDRWTDAEAAIELLKRTQRGRATFLPLDTIRPAPRGNAPRQQGVYGSAADLVDVDAEFVPVVEHVLGRTIVVQDLTVARSLLRQGLRGEQIVTIAGEIVRSSGAVTGGSLRQPADGGLLARERELREIRAQLTRLQDELARTKQRGIEAAAALESHSAALAQVESAAQQARAVARAARERAEAARREHDRAEQQYAWAVDLARREEQEIGTLQERRSKLATELEALAGQVQTTGDEDDFDRDHVASIDRRIAQQREQYNERRSQVSALRATLEAERAALARQEEARQRLAAQLEARRSQVAEADRLLAVLGEQATSLRETIDRLSAEREAITARLEPIVAELTWLEMQEQPLQGRLAELNEQASAAERALARAEAEVEQVRSDLSHLEERMLAELTSEELADAIPGETPPPPDLEPEALRRRIDRLRSQLRQLGPVNPRAVEEYEAAETRHRFLTEQAADLQSTEASLREAIRETEGRIRAGFETAFHALNAEFRRAFTTLFGGGRAELVLTDEQDFATSGIDIVAQPPGKRLMPLSLLSGGERALTGIALVFGLLGVNPTPFCILDEVDAALDEANVARFANAVAAMAGETQFVVITHNRATIETSDAIYGVTMGGDGMSRLLSLRLDKALELAEQHR